MKVYVGQTRSHALIQRLLLAEWGEMTCRGEYPPRRHPWAYDNGAFKDWKAGAQFHVDDFERDVSRIAAAEVKPDFLVVPDLVAGGLRSLEFSMGWAPQLAGVAPLYLAVQDDMTEHDVRPCLEDLAGLFVGGSLAWKIRTGERWVELAHAVGKPCHIGRVGTLRRVQWAREIKADSIDSCLPLWSEDNLMRFVEGLGVATQSDLWRDENNPWTPPNGFWRGFGVTT